MEPINELRPEIISKAALSPYHFCTSPSRMQMYGGSHLSQSLVVEGSEPPLLTTGMDMEFGRFTFNIKAPCNLTVIRVIQKYPPTYDSSRIEQNPMTLLIYENAENGEIGCISVPSHHCLHQHFGFAYNFKPEMAGITQGVELEQGTVLADSPSVKPSGEYGMGLNANVVFMSDPSVIEDGVVISESFAKRMTTLGVEKRSATWGSKRFPINLYGTKDVYKPFPDIGDPIRADGLVFALREYDDLMAPVEMTPEALMRVDYEFDKLYYAPHGAKRARVIDVDVFRGNNRNPPLTPFGMEDQCVKYYEAKRRYCEAVVATYTELRSRRRDLLRVTPEFQRIYKEARIFLDGHRHRVVLIHQRVPLDEWRVELTVEYTLIPTLAFKQTGRYGNKGVVVDVRPDADMPRDAFGNVAEIITDGKSIVKRMNPGVIYEQYVTAADRDMRKRVLEMIQQPTAANVKKAWEYLLGFVRIVSPRMHRMLSSADYRGTPLSFMRGGSERGYDIYSPADNPIDVVQMLTQLREHYRPNFSPVTYRAPSGEMVTTVEDVLIGTVYILLLEKTGGDYSSVDSAKLQHFGIPSKVSKSDKYSSPGRKTPTRTLGEAEVRSVSAFVGGDIVRETLEMSNSPRTHRHVIRNLMDSPTPSNVARIIDRTVIPEGGGRSLDLGRHQLFCSGVRLTYEPCVEDGKIYHDTDSAHALFGDVDESGADAEGERDELEEEEDSKPGKEAPSDDDDSEEDDE